MPSAPPRRFAPTPVETTSRSSKPKDQHDDNEEAVKGQSLLSSQLETTAWPNKDRLPETGDLQTLKAHKVRRFAPEPVESTKRSSRDKESDQHVKKEGRPKPRRFAPEPVETSHKSSKDAKVAERPKSKFAPQLVETTHSSSNNRSPAPTVKAPRKFTPVLINTAQRTRKAGDSRSAAENISKTEAGFKFAAREHRRHITGVATPMEIDEPENSAHLDLGAVNEHAALLRPISPLDGSSLRRFSQQRQHSFRCPDLDTIESSESEAGSDTSSLNEGVTGSPITVSDSSFNEYKHATRTRESVDENFSNYFLQLEAKRAQKRLREQALAAFPNSDFHEPVQHYVNAERDSDSDVSIDYRPVTYDGEEEDVVPSRAARRDSTKVPWEQIELQQHAEKLSQERKANQVTAKKPTDSPWWNAEDDIAAQPDREMRSMRDRARPPMLGGDISFPRCLSPEPARFDVTQGAAALRDQMHAERVASQCKKSEDEATLWSDRSLKKDITMTGTSSNSSGSSDSGAGLWGGFCKDGDKKSAGGLLAPIIPSGLVTPRSESSGDTFDAAFALPHSIEMSTATVQTPPLTPEDMSRHPGSGSINAILVAEHEFQKTLETEFPDSFVTQVYNYLSLGYPSLARPFDEELSKITHIPLADLRADDIKARDTPRGYIRLGSDFEGGGGVEREESCMRWVALKRYVHEWAHQEKNMATDGGPGAKWATAARRGSWGN